MSKKAKPTVTNTVQTTAVDPIAQAAQAKLMSSAGAILDPYLNAGATGYGVAGFNGDQTAAFQGVRDIAANGGLNPADITKFLNPYTSAVVDTTNSTLRDENDKTLAAIRARTAAGSAFGGSGSRGALQEASANEALQKSIASTTAQLMAAGYDRATATAEASAALQQQGVQGLLSIGNQQQQLEQQKLDVPRNALQQLAGLTPQQYGSTTSGTSVGSPASTPGTGQQVLGVLGSIAGMKNGTDSTLGGSLFNNLGSALKTALPALLTASDRELKTDIEKLGDDPDTGLPMYAYRYKSDGKDTPKVVGPMAQDVEKRFPGSTKRIGGKLVIKSPLAILAGVK